MEHVAAYVCTVNWEKSSDWVKYVLENPSSSSTDKMLILSLLNQERTQTNGRTGIGQAN